MIRLVCNGGRRQGEPQQSSYYIRFPFFHAGMVMGDEGVLGDKGDAVDDLAWYEHLGLGLCFGSLGLGLCCCFLSLGLGR